MKHLDSKNLASRLRATCRRGRHGYGPAQDVGGGIFRRVCTGCGAVSIDLREADPVDHETRASTDGWGGGRAGI